MVDQPGAPPGSAPVTDRRPVPRGLMPRGVQTWLMAGLAVGIVAIIVLTGQPEPSAGPVAASAVFAAALLPALAALSIDLAMGVASGAMVLAVMLALTSGAAWPAALTGMATLALGIGLIRAKLEPFASWLDWRWARRGAADESAALGLDAAMDGPAHWRAATIGLAPALLLLPLLWGILAFWLLMLPRRRGQWACLAVPAVAGLGLIFIGGAV